MNKTDKGQHHGVHQGPYRILLKRMTLGLILDPISTTGEQLFTHIKYCAGTDLVFQDKKIS